MVINVSMSYNRNYRNAVSRRGYRNVVSRNVNRDFGQRRNFHSNGYENNRDELSENENETEEETANCHGRSARLPLLIQNELHTLKKILSSFQNGEKKSWPKYIRNLTNHLTTSELFPTALNESRERTFDDTTRVIGKVYITKLFTDIVDELVLCVTALSKHLNSLHSDFFRWMFNLYFSSVAVNQEETQSAVLKSLTSVVKQSENGVNDNLFYIQKNLRKSLEEADNIEMLLQISELMILIGKINPTSLQLHIKDFVDILLGWFLDDHQPPILLYPIETIIYSLDLFWKSNLQFALELLGEFMEDFEKYYEEILAKQNARNSQAVGKLVNSQLHKMALRVRVFAIVFHKMDLASMLFNEHIREGKYNLTYFESIIHLLTKVAISLKSYSEMTFYEEYLSECNQAFTIMLESFSKISKDYDQSLDYNALYQTSLMEYSNILFDKLSNSSAKFIVTSLTCLKAIITGLDTKLSLDFVDKLYDEKYLFLKSYLVDSVQRAYFALHYSILRIKSVEILEKTYQYILKYLRHAFYALYRLKHDCEVKCLILDDIVIESELLEKYYRTEKQCLTSIYSDLVLLSEVANTKNSLIAMWAFSPNVLELITQHINPNNEWLAEHCSSVQYSLVYLLYSHCSKHNHFVAQSSLLHSNVSSQSLSVIPFSSAEPHSTQPSQASVKSTNPSAIRFKSPSHASSYFVSILRLIKSLLKMNKLSVDLITLCMNWVEKIVNIFLENPLKMVPAINSDEFAILIDILSEYSFSNNFEICKTSCKIITSLLPFINDELPIYSSVISNYKKACEFNIAHSNQSISELFLELFAVLPFNSKGVDLASSSTLINRVYNIQNELFLYPEEAHLSLICVMLKQPSEHFSALTFQSIINFIQTHSHNKSFDWLSRIFYSVFDSNQLKISSSLRSTISYLPFLSNNLNSSKIFQNNRWALVFWACWELVQHCVENRLKTPLGKPQDTFTKIESSIKMFIADISNLKMTQNEPSELTMIRIHMLLIIMENFDKLINNAINGNSLRLYTSSKLSKSFFKKNKATCYEWINRNRRSIMLLALKIGEPATVIRQGQELLRAYLTDRSTYTQDEVEFILLLMVEALILLKAPEAIMGFFIWAKECFKVKFNWIKASTDEANSHYEISLNRYKTLLSKMESCALDIASVSNNTSLNLVTSNKNFTCNNYTVNFYQKRILNCFLNLESYEDAVAWSNSSKATCTFNHLVNSNVDYSYLKSLSGFSNSQSYASSTVKSSGKILWCDMDSIFHSMQSQVLEVVSQLYNSDISSRDSFQQLHELQEKLNSLISSFYLCGLSAENYPITNLQKVVFQLGKMLDPSNEKKIRVDFLCQENSNLSLDLLINSLQWHKVYQKLNGKLKFADDSIMKSSLDDLLLKTATKARKTQNFNLSQNLLLQFACSAMELDTDEPNVLVKDRLLEIVHTSLQLPLSQDLIKFCMETSKLFRATGDSEMAASILLKSINCIIEGPISCTDISEPASRMFLKLASYLQIDGSSCENQDFLQLCSSTRFSSVDEQVTSMQNLDHSEKIVGKLLLLGVNTCHSLGKAWYRFADWSYTWGRRLCDLDEERSTTEAVFNATLPQENNVFEFYKLAANSYIKFLHMSTHSGCEDVNATLRLLRLILKHAPELREILEAGLKETPSKPWKNITLQLFSRLNHHETYVRQSISELLCRIGADSPHLVIFPAVAGSLDDQVKSNNYNYTCADEDEEDEDEGSQSVDSSVMQSCYASLLDTLSQHNPQLIAQTKLFVHELRRITVLWDELWIGILQHNLNEVKKQVTLLEKHIEQTKGNANLYDNEKILFIKEQHSISFRRILYSLKLTNMFTSDLPETPHEEWFQRNFNQMINDLIDSIESPENMFEPSNILYHYQTLFQLLRKRSMIVSNFRLQMQDISPKLAHLEETAIPLPGLDSYSAQSVVTIKGVCKTVSVLHTYTKPKKIIFIGSDGRNYTYLFKGHEDLHLDERIMQFLSIVNKMIVKFRSGSSRESKMLYRARHYSVTPLGRKSGLIQWVEGGQALYNFYKKWISNREVSFEEVNKKVTAVDIFKNKLVEKNISLDNRSEWNLSTLKDVFEDLSKETPKELILRELWYCSLNPANYWMLSQNFVTSNAIMSMIGYILGLGDRHLDNILLDLTTGEVIHIDYNVCFEKGKSLRVPEMVLCRLTQNIVHAFGITGIEGTFRISCENILKILRKGRETLLTLLEAFVYDPLVDWTPEHEEGFTGAIYGGAKVAQLAKEGKIIPRKQMERENMEAIARLDQMMKSVEQRNSDWPKISENEEAIQFQCSDFISTDCDAFKLKFSDFATIDPSLSKKNKRNAYAFSVWKKIKMKLDGRDPDINKRLAVSEQVNYVINESMDTDNLARMYEGWTSWV